MGTNLTNSTLSTRRISDVYIYIYQKLVMLIVIYTNVHQTYLLYIPTFIKLIVIYTNVHQTYLRSKSLPMYCTRSNRLFMERSCSIFVLHFYCDLSLCLSNKR